VTVDAHLHTLICIAGRADLMKFLASECDDAGATIVYATHIFDGLESWPSHLMYLANGTLKVRPCCSEDTSLCLLYWLVAHICDHANGR
jgi:ABC-type thiamine transport system ATPase subunit